MKAMAHQQAAAGAARTGGDDSYPFSTLAIWRDKLQAELSDTGRGGPDFKLRLLLEQGKDVEEAVLGCLKDALFDLHEGVVWGLLDPSFEHQQRQHLFNAAANELNTDKQLCVQLAREHGVLDNYAVQLQKPASHTLADYERVGELKFAMLVWRANLKRDASLVRNCTGASGGCGSVVGAPGSPRGAAAGGVAGDPLTIELLFHNAYLDALRLIQRCTRKSLAYWSAQQAGSAPTLASKQRLYQTAVQRVQNTLLEQAETFKLDKEELTRLFEQLSDPDAVEDDKEGTQDEEEESEQGSQGGGSNRSSDVHRTRVSSEESASSILGL